jgi:hypothetical protein
VPAERLRAELGEWGAVVDVVAADLADPEQVRGVLAGVAAEHPLQAVFHLAGVLDDAAVTTLTGQQLHTVLRAKVDTAVHLHDHRPAP